MGNHFRCWSDSTPKSFWMRVSCVTDMRTEAVAWTYCDATASS